MTPKQSYLWRSLTAGWCLLLGAFPGYSRAATVTLSDNLAASTAYTEMVHGQTWVAAPFRSETRATLDVVSLLVANPAAGTAVLDLYSGTTQPDKRVGSLLPPVAYSPQLALAEFVGNNLVLQAATDYWVVLRALSGRFEWAFASTTAGSGQGFSPAWAVTDDAGASWFTQQSEPMQIRVKALAAQATFPALGTFALAALGTILGGLMLLKQRAQQAARHLTLLGTLAVATALLLPTGAAAASPPAVSVLSPRMGTVVRTLGGVSVTLQVDPDARKDSLTVRLNGREVGAEFVRSGGPCWSGGCVYTVLLTTAEGLRPGANMLWIDVATPEGKHGTQLAGFRWLPQTSLSDAPATPNLPPALGFKTLNPGGGAANGGGWIQVYSNQGKGTTWVYPKGAVCTTRYQVVALDRATLAPKQDGGYVDGYQCFDNDPDLINTLKKFTAADLVVAGTTYGHNASAGLDTTAIGGTNYTPAFLSSSPLAPHGYMIVGVGKAAPGTAYENASNADSGDDSWNWARANGLLAADTSYYNFHPSDYVEFKVRPVERSITVGNATYTPPAIDSQGGGFWLLLLDRRNLTSQRACAASAANTYPNCGAYYQTNGTDILTSRPAWAKLAADLKGAGQSQLIFLMAVGQPQSAPDFPSVDLADAINQLGGSGYSLGQLADTAPPQDATGPAFTLVSSNDDGFSQAITGSAVISTNVNDAAQSGQTGYVKGVLGRDHNGLFRPLTTTQETRDTVDTSDAADFSAYSTLWAQPVPWPMTDTPGHLAAYVYLSTQIFANGTKGFDAHDPQRLDVRSYYTNGEIGTILGYHFKLTTDPIFALPSEAPGVGWLNSVDGQRYVFTEADRMDVARQLELEQQYLDQATTFFADLSSALLDNSTNLSSAMFGAMAIVQKSVAANDSAVVKADPSKWIKLAGSIVGLGRAFNPAFGVVSSMLNVAAQLTSIAEGTPTYNSSLIPSAFATYETTVGDFQRDISTFQSNLRLGLEILEDNTYSDWGKLAVVGPNALHAKGWSFGKQTDLSALQLPLQDGAERYFLLQLLGKSYGVDYWPSVIFSSPSAIGTELITSCDKEQIKCTTKCEFFYQKNSPPDGSSQVYRAPGFPILNDIFVIGAPITYGSFSGMPSEQYLSTDLLFKLFNPEGDLRLSRDLFFSPSGPLARRSGPNYAGPASTLTCSQ